MNLPHSGTVLGLDVGYSAKRATTGICVLWWDEKVVEWRTGNARTDEAHRLDTLKRIWPVGKDWRVLAVAVDGPLRPGFDYLVEYRACEALLSSGAFPETRQWTCPSVDTNITVAAYSTHWLTLIATTVKPRTYDSYRKTLRLHLLPTLGRVKLRQLQKVKIKALLAEKLASGLSPNSVRIIHATLRVLLHAAVDDSVLHANPAEKLGRQLHLVKRASTRQEEIKAMTKEQRQHFLDTAARVEPKYYPLFFTLAGTGMRLGEGLALQWEDLYLDAREIRVARAISAGVINTPKAGHGRTVDISKFLINMLGRLHIQRKAEKLKSGSSEMSSWAFCTSTGTPLDESKVRKAMTRVLKAAGLPAHYSPHCLRHTYASLMLQQGESPAYVQRQLGHASIQLTVDTYGKWLQTENKGAVDRLDEASGSKMVATGKYASEVTAEDTDLLVGRAGIEPAAR